jgi:hypothetical protein
VSVPGGTEHFYISTACLHEVNDPTLHGQCRLFCKFCHAQCQCVRHVDDPVVLPDVDATVW